MKRRRFTTLAVLAGAGLSGCRKDQAQPVLEPEPVVEGGYDLEAMDRATEAARAEIDFFLEKLESGQGENHSVKAPVRDGEKMEHFWLTDVRYDDGRFTGSIGNTPEIVSTVKEGDEYSLARDEISDWLYLENELLHGNFTLRVLIPTLDPEKRTRYFSKLAELPE